MKKIVAVFLAVSLLTAVGILPAAATDEAQQDTQITEEEKKEAKPAGKDIIQIEIAKEPEEGPELWEKYFYLDVDQNLNEDSQTAWTRVGVHKGSLDISVGWSQKFNEPETEPADKGIVSFSISFWW